MIDEQVLINNIILLSSRIALAHEELMTLRHGQMPQSLDELADRLDVAMGYLEGDADPVDHNDDEEKLFMN